MLKIQGPQSFLSWQRHSHSKIRFSVVSSCNPRFLHKGSPVNMPILCIYFWRWQCKVTNTTTFLILLLHNERSSNAICRGCKVRHYSSLLLQLFLCSFWAQVLYTCINNVLDIPLNISGPMSFDADTLLRSTFDCCQCLLNKSTNSASISNTVKQPYSGHIEI